MSFTLNYTFSKITQVSASGSHKLMLRDNGTAENIGCVQKI